MFRRRRPLLRAAVVGGGAYMAGKAHARNQAEQAADQDDQDARISDARAAAGLPAAGPAPARAGPAPAAASSMIDQLNQLATLHQQGVLTDDEFAAAKAKLFGS